MKKLFVLFIVSILFVSCKNEQNAHSFYEKALDSYSKQDFSKAVEYIDLTLKYSSDFYQAKFLKAKILYFLNESQTALKIIDSLVKKYPEYTEARIWKIRLLIDLKQYEKAESMLVRELSFNPSDWRLYYQYSLLSERKEQMDRRLVMLYGFGDEKGLELLDDVLNKKASLAAGSGPGNAQTVRENGKRVVYLNNYSNDMTREEQLKLGITLGHEAYRDGVKGDELTQKIETRNAVAGHTDMMTRMLGDSMYAGTLSSIIAGDRNLQLDLIASSLGDDVFNDYVDNCYDSSADYWRMTWGGQLINDGQGWLVDENGMYINIDGTRSPVPVNGQTLGAGTFDEKGKPEKGSIETGLLNIIAGTSGQEYSSFSNEEIKAAQALMTGADTPMKPLNPDANFRDFKWSQDSLGQKIDMSSFMETAGANVNQEIFKTYYNNTVDSQISKMLGLDLGFDTGKEIPKNQYGNYVSMLGSRLSDYFSTGNAKQALTDKYFQTIVNENGESTKFYKLDKNNPFLDEVLGQHDLKGVNPSIDAEGCNFMTILSIPQLLTGTIFEKNDVLDIWNKSISEDYKYINQAAWVNNRSGIAELALNKTNLRNKNIHITINDKTYKDYNHQQIGNRINWLTTSGNPYHYSLGSIDNTNIYNPGYTIKPSKITTSIDLWWK